ncbi:MAG: SGNH/GDSL hydrolase family protein [Pirellulaceae bacterium]
MKRVLLILIVSSFAFFAAAAPCGAQTPPAEPTNAAEAAAQQARQEAELEAKYQVWVKTLSPPRQAWERVLQAELGGFYLPIHKREKVAGRANAWDFVEDDPALPRVLLIGDSVSRAYTQTVRKQLAGKANVHRAPANCGPTATGVKKIDVWLGDGKWDLIHFNFGIHDRATPIGDYTQRLEQLIQRMQQTGATLVWASTTPIPDLPEKKYTADSIVERNAAAAEVMEKHDIAIDDLFAAVTPRLAELQNANDVHFNGPGNEFLGQQVARFLEPRLGRRFELTARASEIDARAKAHPEIGFVFADEKGQPQDVQHAIVDTRVAPRGQLVIWLMGHNQGLFERIAGYGLHAVQVHYANRWFGSLDAERRDDGVTLGKIRLEAATGEDHSPIVEIPPADGMQARALEFVKWLARENPEGEWEQFLTDDRGDLQWEKVIVAGISHGSTTAARFAKHQKLARVVMFSGPRDQFESWQGFPSATPANRYFGFTHVLDGGWTGDHYCRSWQMLGLAEFGPIVNVDEVAPPFGDSRRLITNSDVDDNPRRAHTMVVPGGSAVKDDQGRYVHEAVWRYLFTHPVDRVGKPTPLDPDCRVAPSR